MSRLPSVIKALTVSQPWASLIASGKKRIENRRWETGYRGWLAIHAGSGTQYLNKKQLQEYPTGQVIAVAQLLECCRVEDVSAELLSSQREYAEGPYCWLLGEITPVRGLAVAGKQGLWDFETSGVVAAKTEEQTLPGWVIRCKEAGEVVVGGIRMHCALAEAERLFERIAIHIEDGRLPESLAEGLAIGELMRCRKG